MLLFGMFVLLFVVVRALGADDGPAAERDPSRELYERTPSRRPPLREGEGRGGT